MENFDKRHHELQNAVNSVIYHAPKQPFAMDELINALKTKLPEDTSSEDVFYATEMLKGTVCRLVLSDSIRKIDDEHYLMNED